ncbi:sensor histidine kinase [Paenibacillus humicola]|uniref:sensor histidine kinase n=1 Tax=Paenibacillus humicola TaxID=3110540 RepID=UPI00237AE21A|nr:HAMP domain-containing sensor histidine kinase [Paenibacillus humicola]
MSIRKKLILSYIGMILIPFLLFIATSFLLVTFFFKDAFGPHTHTIWGRNAAGETQQFPGYMSERNKWLDGITLFAEYDPDKLADPAFLQHADQSLQPLDSALAVVRGGRLLFASAALPAEGLAANLESSTAQAGPDGSSQEKGPNGWGGPQLAIGGHSYSVERQPLAFADGSQGAVYFLTDTGRTVRFFRTLVPLLLLALLLAIALTNGLLTALVSRSIIPPLRELKRAAERIKEGELGHELKPGKRDEIGELSDAFEDMRRRLQESVRLQLQYEDNRKELFSSISHDLKTPITAITACAEAMRDGIASAPGMQIKYIDMIHKKAGDMDRLIDELFLFSKLDLHRLPFHFEPVDLRAFLRDCAEDLRLNPQNGGVRVVFAEADGPPVMADADREKLQRVVTNIVDNSLKFMEAGSGAAGAKEIRFTLDAAGNAGQVTVGVRDNGPGIKPEALPHIFERFYREDAARTPGTGGSGLGLAIVKRIVEEHGGRVWAESVPGSGTSIYFTLNRSSGPVREEGGANEAGADH